MRVLPLVSLVALLLIPGFSASVADSAVIADGGLDAYGRALAVDGGLALASYQDAGIGEVQVLERTGGVWTATASLTHPAASPQFGRSVAIADGQAVVADPRFDQTPGGDEGAVFVFEKLAGSWQLTQTLLGDADADLMGRDLAIDDGRLAVGGDGIVYVYDASTWSIDQAIGGPASFDFGFSVSIQGELLAVGSPRYTEYICDYLSCTDHCYPGDVTCCSTCYEASVRGRVTMYNLQNGEWRRTTDLYGSDDSQQGWEVEIAGSYVYMLRRPLDGGWGVASHRLGGLGGAPDPIYNMDLIPGGAGTARLASHDDTLFVGMPDTARHTDCPQASGATDVACTLVHTRGGGAQGRVEAYGPDILGPALQEVYESASSDTHVGKLVATDGETLLATGDDGVYVFEL